AVIANSARHHWYACVSSGSHVTKWLRSSVKYGSVSAKLTLERHSASVVQDGNATRLTAVMPRLTAAVSARSLVDGTSSPNSTLPSRFGTINAATDLRTEDMLIHVKAIPTTSAQPYSHRTFDTCAPHTDSAPRLANHSWSE